MISMLSEQLGSCYFPEKGMETEIKKYVRNSKERQEVGHDIVSKKPVKADGEKSCALYGLK